MPRIYSFQLHPLCAWAVLPASVVANVHGYDSCSCLAMRVCFPRRRLMETRLPAMAVAVKLTAPAAAVQDSLADGPEPGVPAGNAGAFGVLDEDGGLLGRLAEEAVDDVHVSFLK